MKHYLFILFLGISISTVFAKQECKTKSSSNSEGLLDFLSLFRSNDEDKPETVQVRIPDSLRTEIHEFSVGVSLLIPNGTSDLSAGGLEVGMYKELNKVSGFYLGGSAYALRYGSGSYDTLMGVYDYISTYHNIYGISFNAKQRIVNTNGFKAYLGLETGLSLFQTNVWAKDLPQPCECEKPRRLLGEWGRVSPRFGPTLDLSVPTGSIYDRISFSVGYQMMGITDLIRKGDVDFSPNKIDFNPTRERLNMLNIQVGFSHFF